MRVLAIILTIICITMNLTGCTAGNKEKQLVDDKLQENKTQSQSIDGKTRSLLGSLVDDKLVPIDVPVDSYNIHYCHWSPDGQWLVYGNKGDLFIYNYKTGKKVNLTNTPDRYELMPSWSPDGSMLCFTSRPIHPDERSSAERRSEKRRKQLELEGSNELHPDERSKQQFDDDWVMSGAWGGSPTIIRLDGTGYEILEEGLTVNPSWSPDGKTIAYGSGESIHLYNLKDHKAKVLSPEDIGLEAKYIGSPSWSPTRSEIAFFFSLKDKEPTREEIMGGTAIPTKQGFALLDLQTNEVKVLYTFEALFTSIRLPVLWNADGSKLAFHLKAEGLVNNPTGLMVTNREGGTVRKIGEAYQAIWEPNGNRLAYLDSTAAYYTVRIVSFDGDAYTTKTVEHENIFNGGITWQPILKN